MDEIKFNLNKLPEFPKSIEKMGVDTPLSEEEKDSIIKFMKEADQSSNNDGFITRDELNLAPYSSSPASWQAMRVFEEWKKQSAQEEKPQGTPPDRNQTQERTDIEKTLEEFRVQERNQQEILNKKQQELNKSASDIATATKDAKIELTSSSTTSRGGASADGKIGVYNFQYNLYSDNKYPAELTLTDSTGKEVKFENPEKYKELEPLLKKIKSAIEDNPNNQELILRYSCQFSSRFQ